MNWTAVTLGGLAGFTIFIGLPIAFLKNLNQRVRGFLTAMSTGILVFLLVEITGKVIDSIEDLAVSSASGFPRWGDTLFYAGLFAVGLFIGLMGLVWFEKMFITSAKDVDLAPAQNARKVSMMIAMGIGLHNFSEGLAIGQAYSWGNSQLAWLLVVGFALHNATEGFGIVGPLSGHPTVLGFPRADGLDRRRSDAFGFAHRKFLDRKALGSLFSVDGFRLYPVCRGRTSASRPKIKRRHRGFRGPIGRFFSGLYHRTDHYDRLRRSRTIVILLDLRR